MAFQKETLILGSGPCADQVADRLSALGITVRRTTMNGADIGAPITLSGESPDPQPKRLSLVDCRGQAGNFHVTLADQEKRIACKVGSIVVSQECLRLSNHDLYGLIPSERIIALSTLEAAQKQNVLGTLVQAGAKIAFLNSWSVDSHPVMSQAMLVQCLAMQNTSDVNTFFLCGNLKVSADGMEACCEEAKSAGTVFLKFTQRFPVLTPLVDGRLQIDYWDETTRMDYRLVADLVVVDERIVPHPELTQTIRRLRLETDGFGFAQTDNVHRLPNWTNRRGIFVADGARAVLSGAAQAVDADQVALEVVTFLSDQDRPPLPWVEIDQGRCARCLTCYRLCPYAAIEMEPRMTIDPAACQSCGLCTAACPNRAIGIHDTELDKALAQVTGQGGAEANGDDVFMPRIAAFCCSRSAVQARDLARNSGYDLPAGLVFVEGICGGTFSVHHLLSAIEAGMDGVLVLTCHDGNCHSERGSRQARKRVAEAIRLLSWTGLPGNRVQFNTLAANMGVEFMQIVNSFAQKIQSIGPAVEQV